MELKAEKESAHSSTVCSVTFSPDSKTIVSGSTDKTIKFWDAGGLALPIRNQNSNPNLTFSLLVAATLELKAEEQSAHIGRVWSVAFSPDGKNIVSGSQDKTIKVWDAGLSTDTLKP